MTTGSYLSILTSNVSGLNAPTKRQRLIEQIQKKDTYICCLQETHLKPRDTYGLKVKGWRKVLTENGDQKKAGTAILITDKREFKDHYERQKTLHNDQGVIPRRRQNNYKYICTQHRSTSM